MTNNQIVINNLSKVYDNGFNALKNINLNIRKGEIFAMLGPNGAGKTTLISIICGIVNPTSGEVKVDNFDIINDYRETRSKIGLVPQETFTSFVSQSLLFLSFVVATFLPFLVIKAKKL